MPDYQKSKIYKIWDNNYTECYVGSTTQDLSVRMAEHRKFYKQYLEGKRNNYTSFDLFKKYGVENCRIELEEAYACNNKEEPTAREGVIIRRDKCVNKHINGRTHKEWYIDNKAEERYKRKQHYEKHKERFLSQQKQKYNCPCGSIGTIHHKARHEKSLKHQQRLNSLNQETSDETP